MTIREQVLAAAHEVIRSFEEASARGDALLKRAEDAESALEEMKERLLAGDINVMLGNGDMVDAGWTRQLDANNRLHATLVRAENAEAAFKVLTSKYVREQSNRSEIEEARKKLREAVEHDRKTASASSQEAVWQRAGVLERVLSAGEMPSGQHRARVLREAADVCDRIADALDVRSAPAEICRDRLRALADEAENTK